MWGFPWTQMKLSTEPMCGLIVDGFRSAGNQPASVTFPEETSTSTIWVPTCHLPNSLQVHHNGKPEREAYHLGANWHDLRIGPSAVAESSAMGAHREAGIVPSQHTPLAATGTTATTTASLEDLGFLDLTITDSEKASFHGAGTESDPICFD